MDFSGYENGADFLRDAIEKACKPLEIRKYIRVDTYDDKAQPIWNKAVEKLKADSKTLPGRLIAFLLLLKYVTWISNIQKHTDYAQADRHIKAKFKTRIGTALKRCETLKPLILGQLDEAIERQKNAKVEEEVASAPAYASAPASTPSADNFANQPSAPPPPSAEDASKPDYANPPSYPSIGATGSASSLQSSACPDEKGSAAASAPPAPESGASSGSRPSKMDRWRFLRSTMLTPEQQRHMQSYMNPPPEADAPQKPVYKKMVAGSFSQQAMGKNGNQACMTIALNLLASVLAGTLTLPLSVEQMDDLVRMGVEVHVGYCKQKGFEIVEPRAFDEILPAVTYIHMEATNIEFGECSALTADTEQSLQSVATKVLSPPGRRYYLFTMRGLATAIITEPEARGTVMYFDSHRRHPVTGLPDADGVAVQILFESVEQFIDYLMTLHKTANDYFELVELKKGIPRYNPNA